MLQFETTFHSYLTFLLCDVFVWIIVWICTSNGKYFPFYSFNSVSMLSPHIIPTSVLYICWSRPNPLHSFSSSVNVFDWLKSHADAFSFAASKKQTQTRRGSSDLPILKTKTKEHKRSLKIRENIFKRKFMSVLSCKFLLQIYRNVVTWNGMEYGIWGHFLKSFYLS